MRQAVPAITDNGATLKWRFRHEPEGRKTLRLHMPYVLASGQAHPRQDVARLRGSHRPTIGPWLARSEAGGLEALLARYVPAGKPLSLPQTCWPPLRKRSGSPPAWPPARPCAAGSSRPITWRATVTPATPSSGPSSKPSSRARGPATNKTPDALRAFQATRQERLQRVIPPDNARLVRVFSQDESRVGLLAVRRRRLTTRGVQPGGSVPHAFDRFYVDGAVAPATGERCLRE